MNDIYLKNDIMRRVRFIHTLRSIADSLLVKAVGFGVLLAGLSVFISVLNVIKNVWSAVSAGTIPLFVVSAFSRTGFAVQLLCIATAIVLALMVRDAIRKISLARLSIQQ